VSRLLLLRASELSRNLIYVVCAKFRGVAVGRGMPFLLYSSMNALSILVYFASPRVGNLG
jgi:hypothetical protein